MKLNPKFKTRITKNETITVAMPDAGFNGFFRSKDEISKLIIECLQTETTQAEIVEKIFTNYDVEQERVENDVAEIITKLKEIGAIIE